MKKMLSLVLVILILFGATGCVEKVDTSIEPSAIYYCNTKLFSFRNTQIVISRDNKDGEKLYQIEGNIFRLVTDPINMYQFEGDSVNKDKIIGNASDTYHLFTQDDHSIYLLGDFVFAMTGKVDLLRNSYDIVNYDGSSVGFAEFDPLDLTGSLYNVEGNLIATYTAAWLNEFGFLQDYDYVVKIYDSSFAPEEAILLLFASYNSDKTADRLSSSNSNSSNNN